jgi:hypothetical protein
MKKEFYSKNNEIDLLTDKFYKKTIKLIGIDNTNQTRGSYLKYGKKKSCDLDLYKNIFINDLQIKNQILKNYINKIKKNEDKLIILEMKLDIFDERINNVMNTLGHINGLFDVVNYNLTIDNNLPDNIKLNIEELDLKYRKNKDIKSYLELYYYVKSFLQPNLSFDNLLSGTVTFNDKIINIYNTNYTFFHIEVLIDNFSVSNHISFKKNLMDRNMYIQKINSIITNNEFDYYKILKKFQTFLKWGYYNIHLNSSCIDLYNKIYEFKNKLGTINYKYCKYTNLKIIVKDPSELKIIDAKIKKYYKKLNERSKKIYLNNYLDYKEYLEKYVIYK